LTTQGNRPFRTASVPARNIGKSLRRFQPRTLS
jgi:hypothetical protein